MAITEDSIKEYIKNFLGYPTVSVELDDSHYDFAIDHAKMWYAQNIGQVKTVPFVTTGNGEVLGTAIASDVDTVCDVVFRSSGAGFDDLFAWADVEWNPYTFVFSSNGGYSDIVQFMQYREMGKVITSSDREWDWDRTRRTLVISPKPDGGESILILYYSTGIDLSYLTVYEINMVRDWALAQAMRRLSIIRTKFAEKPSAMGSFTMDGDNLWTNAETIETELKEKIGNMQLPTGLWAR